MKKNSFIYSTLILIIANFSVRFLGFIYKILLSRLLGSEGIGLFQLVFHVFLVVITVTSSGIPLAVSKITAQKKSLGNYNECRKTLFAGITLGLALSIILCILTFNNIEFIIRYVIKSEKLRNSLLVLIPAIPLVTLSSIFRSYFYGLKNVLPSANAQIVEQFLRVFFVIGLLYILEPENLMVSVMIAAVGIGVGEIGGLILLVFKYRSYSSYSLKNGVKKSHSAGLTSLLGKIIVISFPITIAKLVSVLLQSVNMFLVPQRLQVAGYSFEQAVKTFGEVVGMTMPLLFLPFIVTSAFVVNLIPSISAENTLIKSPNNSTSIGHKSILSLRVALLISIPTAFIFFFFSAPICSFLYNKPSVGIYLRYLSFSVIFLSLHHIIGGILHGLGKQVITTINYLIGMSINLICIYNLVSIPRFGINGFIIGFITASFIIFFLNLSALRYFMKLKIKVINYIVNPIISSILMIIVIILCNRYLVLLGFPIQISVLIPTLIGGFVYLLCILITGSIKFETIKYVFSIHK